MEIKSDSLNNKNEKIEEEKKIHRNFIIQQLAKNGSENINISKPSKNFKMDWFPKAPHPSSSAFLSSNTSTDSDKLCWFCKSRNHETGDPKCSNYSSIISSIKGFLFKKFFHFFNCYLKKKKERKRGRDLERKIQNLQRKIKKLIV